MSLWAPGAGGRRPPPQPNPNSGGVKPLRAYRRQPYPPREERNDMYHESESYDSLEQQDDYSATTNYEAYEHSAPQPHQAHHPNVASSTGEDERSSLYQRLYEQFHGDGAKKPADCVVLSVNNQNSDYPKSLGHCLQDRGLSVEMLYLQAESGLTRALQDVRSDGSPLCILVEQTNVTLSSCTVIIFSESLKIHRNMPKDQAMEFVVEEFGRLSSGRRQRDPVEAETQVTELTDDYLERAKLECHFVPSTTRHLLFLMAEGLHLYPEELSTIAEYIQNRQDHLQKLPSEAESEVAPETLNSFSAGLGKPPPLLPNPVGPSQPISEHPIPPSGMASYLKTKPPPLLSVDVLQRSPHRPPVPHGPPAPHVPGTPHAPSAPHVPPAPHASPASNAPPASHVLSDPYVPPAPHGPPDPYAPPAPHGPPDSYAPPVPHGPPAPHAAPAPHGTPAPPTPHAPPAPYGLDAPHGSSAPHGQGPPHGPPASYALQSSFSPQPPRGPPGPRGVLGPRGPPVLRSLLGPREPPVSCGPQPRQGPPRLPGPPATHGPADHGPHDFHPPRGPLIRHGPPLLRGPPSQNGPGVPRGPPLLRGPRAPPPALKSLHMGNPTAPRPMRRLLP